MVEILLLRFEALLMSFGAPAVDSLRVTCDHPSRSMLAGLMANALGWDHRDADRTQRLQERIRWAARQDRAGFRLVDYQTVDLAQDFLTDCGWTTRGSPEGREGSAKKDTHIRHRHYLADAVYTIAVRLEPPEEDPGIGALERSVRSPERPLFLGRKCCLPSTPIFLARVEAGTLRQALENAPLACRSTATCGAPDLRSWWPAGEDRDVPGQVLPVTEDRDWLNQIHGGRRFIKEGWIRYPGVTHDR